MSEQSNDQSTGQRLKAAIRRFTVDVDDGETPNGYFEKAIDTIRKAVEPRQFHKDPDGTRRAICAAMAVMCKEMATDTKELREAADAYFCEDFTKHAGDKT